MHGKIPNFHLIILADNKQPDTENAIEFLNFTKKDHGLNAEGYLTIWKHNCGLKLSIPIKHSLTVGPDSSVFNPRLICIPMLNTQNPKLISVPT